MQFQGMTWWNAVSRVFHYSSHNHTLKLMTWNVWIFPKGLVAKNTQLYGFTNTWFSSHDCVQKRTYWSWFHLHVCVITQASLDPLPLFLWWPSHAWMLSLVKTHSEVHTLTYQFFLILLSVDSIFSLNMRWSREQQKVWLRVSTYIWTLHLSPHIHAHLLTLVSHIIHFLNTAQWGLWIYGVLIWLPWL